MTSLVNQLFYPIKLSNISFRANELHGSTASTELRKSFGLCNSGRSIACSCVVSPTNWKPADEFPASKNNVRILKSVNL